jgi:hypothetical protein
MTGFVLTWPLKGSETSFKNLSAPLSVAAGSSRLVNVPSNRTEDSMVMITSEIACDQANYRKGGVASVSFDAYAASCRSLGAVVFVIKVSFDAKKMKEIV